MIMSNVASFAFDKSYWCYSGYRLEGIFGRLVCVEPRLFITLHNWLVQYICSNSKEYYSLLEFTGLSDHLFS